MNGRPLAGRYSELVLASTSSARRALMTSLGIPFRALAPGVDEVVAEGTAVKDAVAMLAERKARAIVKQLSQALVIGSDQLVSLDGRALGKPHDALEAFTQLKSLAGRSHDICTAVCVVGPGFHATEVDLARLTIHPLSDGEIQRYVDTNEWQGCAGGYRVEARGQALFARIDGDRTAIQGLPMLRLTRLLREARVEFF